MSIKMHKMSFGQQKSAFLILKLYKTSLKLLKKNRIIYIIYRYLHYRYLHYLSLLLFPSQTQR